MTHKELFLDLMDLMKGRLMDQERTRLKDA